MKSVVLVFTFIFLITFLLTESFEVKRSLNSNANSYDNSLLPGILNDAEDMRVINKRSNEKLTDSKSKSNSKSKKNKEKRPSIKIETYEDKKLRIIAKAIKELAAAIAKLALEVQQRLNGAPTNPPSKTTKSTTSTTKRTSKKSSNASKNKNN